MFFPQIHANDLLSNDIFDFFPIFLRYARPCRNNEHAMSTLSRDHVVAGYTQYGHMFLGMMLSNDADEPNNTEMDFFFSTFIILTTCLVKRYVQSSVKTKNVQGARLWNRSYAVYAYATCSNRRD